MVITKDLNGLEVYKRLKSYMNFLDFFKQTILKASEPMLITTPELDKPGPIIIFVNEKMCQQTGYSFEEIVGQTPRILQGDKTNKDILANLKKELLENNVFTAETVNYKKDKTEYKVRIVICPIFNEKGQVSNYVGIHQIL